MSAFTVQKSNGRHVGVYDSLDAAQDVAHLNAADFGGVFEVVEHVGDAERMVCSFEAGVGSWPEPQYADAER